MSTLYKFFFFCFTVHTYIYCFKHETLVSRPVCSNILKITFGHMKWKNFNWPRYKRNIVPALLQSNVNEYSSRWRQGNPKTLNPLRKSRLPGKIVKYKSIDTVIDKEQYVNIPTEFWNSLEFHRMLINIACSLS